MAAAVAIVSGGPVAIVAATEPGYLETIRAWIRGMALDRSAKTYGWRDLAVYGGWVLSLGPIVVLGAGSWLVRAGSAFWRRPTLLLAITAPSVAQIVWMATFRGVWYSPRFLLSAFPGACAVPGALLLAGWAGGSRSRVVAVVMAIVVPLAIAAPVVRARSALLEATIHDWPGRLTSLPPRSVIVSGLPCAAVPFVREMVLRDVSRTTAPPEWQAVCPGWGWPADLPATLDRAMDEGRTVAIDLRPASWVGPEQRAAMGQAVAYVNRHQRRAGRPLIVWR